MNKTLIRIRNHFLLSAVLSALFAGIYESFSHGVTSMAMVLAFLFPLLGGAFPYGLLHRVPLQAQPGWISRFLYNSGIASLTLGSIFHGILEIYGTTSRLEVPYWIAGGVLCGAGLILYLTESFVRLAKQ